MHGKDLSAAVKAPNGAHSVVFRQNRTELTVHLQMIPNSSEYEPIALSNE